MNRTSSGIFVEFFGEKQSNCMISFWIFSIQSTSLMTNHFENNENIFSVTIRHCFDNGSVAGAIGRRRIFQGQYVNEALFNVESLFTFHSGRVPRCLGMPATEPCQTISAYNFQPLIVSKDVIARRICIAGNSNFMDVE